MTNKKIHRRILSLMMAFLMILQTTVAPVSATSWEGEGDPAGSTVPEESTAPAEPALKNTYALVLATGGQSGDAIQYFKIIYEDTAGIRRSEYILKDDSLASLKMAKTYGNRDDRRQVASERFYMMDGKKETSSDHGRPLQLEGFKPLQPEQKDTYLFETAYDVKRILGLEIMQNSGQWDCQGLWIYQVDQIFGEEMYGYVSGESYISFSGWRLAELEMTHKSGQLIYTTLQNSRPKLYRMGENSHPEYNLIIYDRSEAKYDSTKNTREYAMRLDITDVYGGGIGDGGILGSVFGTIENTTLRDSLRMDIRYQDTFGCVQSFSVNVLPSSLLWALDNGVPASTKLAGYAHQGDTLLFPMKIPYFADLLELKLHTDLPAGDMVVNWSSIAMYDLGLSLASVTVDPARAAIVPSITYNPVYLWETSSRQGYAMGDAETFNCEMKFNEENRAMVDEPLVDEYLVEITTDTMPSAGTTEDISILLNYKTYGGVEQRTEKIMLREQGKDFHGVTPGGEDMYYWMAMRPGGTLHFRISLPYVSEFTGATFAIEGNGNDEWQLGNLKIYRLEELSKREVTWGNFVSGGGRSDRYYDRSFKGELVFSGNRSVLVQKGDPVTMGTGDGTASSESTLPGSSVSWGDVKYSMSYEEALQNIGFTTTRNNYQVEVTVAGNTAQAGTEDAGSKNQFYFQLVFQDGSSGYVLANQQLSGDGFRAGYTETFTIRTNQDYGELVSVRIIPEDISSKSDTFDKLNIESIQVVRRSDGGLSRQWALERVGWIDIDFIDEGAASGMLGQTGRTEDEIARTFNVTYSTYAVNLLVSLTTLGMPFSGTVYGDICYYNSNGEAKHKGFDIVELMYQYANRTPKYTSSNNGAVSALPSAYAWSDSHMFQADKTDRFIITLSDVREIAYLEVDAYMDTLTEGQGGTWNIGGVAISLIESEGQLLINANDEYERDNEVHLVTTNVDTGRIPAYQLLMEYGAMTKARIRFVENDIDLDTDRGNVSVLAREPVSENDVLNIFIYPDLEKSEPSNTYTLKAAATYTSPRGMRQASAGELNLSRDGSMFYAIGVKAGGMTVLNELAIQAENPERIPNTYIKRAIVQQVRSGVLINTYEFDFQSGYAAYGQSNAPITEVPGYVPTFIEEQKVLISIGEGLREPLMLQPESKDLAVALSYIPVDSAEGNTKEYDTPFIFLTDQQITMLRSGQTVTVTFNEDYIKEITGVVLVATGGISVPVDMACVATASVATATGERVEHGWYSFSGFVDGIYGSDVSRTDRQLGYTGDSVKPLKLQFVTAPATMDTESGVNGGVEMTISYVDDYGVIRTKTISDLRPYATTATPFATDTVTEVELLVAGMSEIRWLEVRPYDSKPETDLTWKLSSVTAQLGNDGEVQKRSVDATKAILESTGRKINFSTVAVQVNVHALSNTGTPTYVEAMNESVNILLDSGQSARMDVEISGSDKGYDVVAERSTDLEGTATADASDFLQKTGDVLTFSPERNYTGGKIYYRITVISREVGTKTVINLVQEPETALSATEMKAGTNDEGGSL